MENMASSRARRNGEVKERRKGACSNMEKKILEELDRTTQKSYDFTAHPCMHEGTLWPDLKHAHQI